MTNAIVIKPIFDSEDDLWFAGTRTGLPFGPWSQRGEFYAWPNVDGSLPDSACAYQTREQAQIACDVLSQMTREQLQALDAGFFEGGI